MRAELSRYSDKVDIDPERLQQLEERLNIIQSLKRKYGATLTEVLAFGEEAAAKLQSLEQRDAELARLNAELAKAPSELWRRRPGAFHQTPQNHSAAQQGGKQATGRPRLQTKPYRCGAEWPDRKEVNALSLPQPS